MNSLTSFRLFFVVSLLLGTAGTQAADLPAADSFGFDWINPDKARCTKVSAPLLAKFIRCTYQRQGGFDGVTATHTCTLAAGGEYLVFKNRKICQEQLETMKANAP